MVKEMVGTRPEEFSSVISLREERTIVSLGGGGGGEGVERSGEGGRRGLKRVGWFPEERRSPSSSLLGRLSSPRSLGELF